MSVKEIRDADKKKLAIFGSNNVIAGLKRGSVTSVFLSKNCNKDLVDKIKSIASASGAKVSVMDETSEELGVLCKKTFSVSVIGSMKKNE